MMMMMIMLSTRQKSFNKVSLKDADDNEEDEDDEADDEFKHVPINVMNRIKTIRNLHNSIEAIDAEYKAERILLERKYIEKKALINIDRTKIISGEVEPPTIVDEESADTAGSSPMLYYPVFSSSSFTLYMLPR